MDPCAKTEIFDSGVTESRLVWYNPAAITASCMLVEAE